MSKIHDIINKRLDEQYGKDGYNLKMQEMPMPKPTDTDEKREPKTIERPYYDDTWLGRVVLAHRFAPSQDKEKVHKILDALNRRGGQCPCGGMGEQFKCPCRIMREQGICKCGLFQSVKDREIGRSSSTAAVVEDE